MLDKLKNLFSHKPDPETKRVAIFPGIRIPYQEFKHHLPPHAADLQIEQAWIDFLIWGAMCCKKVEKKKKRWKFCAEDCPNIFSDVNDVFVCEHLNRELTMVGSAFLRLPECIAESIRMEYVGD